VADIPLWKYIVGGTMTALAVFWPYIKSAVLSFRNAQISKGFPTPVGSDDTPDPIIAEWAKQVVVAAAGSDDHVKMEYILAGKTLMEIMRLERDRLRKELLQATTTAAPKE